MRLLSGNGRDAVSTISSIRTVPYAPANRSETYTVIRCHTLPPFASVPASACPRGSRRPRASRREHEDVRRIALGTPLDIQLEDLDRFAKEVIPAFRVTKMAAAAK
jgi:hypothetical protein